MTIFDGKRLTNETFRLDVDGLRRGHYADAYFRNVVTILQALEAEGYTYDGTPSRSLTVTPEAVHTGDIHVEAQIFNRRKPSAIAAGVDVALAMLRHATGYFDGDTFVNTWADLDVRALQDGDVTYYNGEPREVQPVIKVRGRYRDFALLETTMLGALTRATRVATNVYELLLAANGKPALFFPARFDVPDVQAIDGYAYWLAVQRYNHDHDASLRPLVSVDAQAAWWGGTGGGTIPHALIACFLGDTAEAMIHFARFMPLETPRIALVDFNNHSVEASLRTLDAFWPRYLAALHADDADGQRRWALNGVRLDTNSGMLDESLNIGDDTGVTPKLCEIVRRELDNAWTRWDVPAGFEDVAKAFCQDVQIVASGGFNADKVARFEAVGAPVDSYGVGSSFLHNTGGTDYTMDVVRVKLAGTWVDMPKVGRAPSEHPNLKPVEEE